MQGMKKRLFSHLRALITKPRQTTRRGKKWVRRSAVILTLGAVGTFAFALRPAFVPDSATLATEAVQHIPARLRDARDSLAPMDIAYSWDMLAHPSGTIILGDLEPDAFSQLREARWNIRLRQEGGQLSVHAEAPVFHAQDARCAVHTRFHAAPGERTLQRMPNGRDHILYHVQLMCEVRIELPFWQPGIRSIALQQLVIDPVDGAVDISTTPNLLPALKAWHDGRPANASGPATSPPRRLIRSAQPSGLPERYCGSPRQQQLTRIVYSLADMVDGGQVRRLLPGVKRSARELAELLPEPAAPWPQCWGDEADMAQQLARRLTPVLVTMQENACFGSQELADFINGEDFGLLFGNNFCGDGEAENSPLPPPPATESGM